MTFYLKYRPQRIAELDLDSVRNELNTILTSGKYSHAYLFVGPRGSGKTSAARILAKVVNCKKNKPEGKKKTTLKLVEPCNSCTSCLEITNGNSLDVIEIDAASNRGIDDIRELRERIKLAPTKSHLKVYIIDEVHMLTNEAFNALLKTLEEPPAHVLFVLCTTEPHKVPQTIVSRCTKITFKKASTKEMATSLRKVIKGENLSYEEGVLESIAQTVDGSFRDGVKMLEQLAMHISSKGSHKGKIKLEDVKKITGYAGETTARKLLLALADFDKKTTFLIIEESSKSGVATEQLIRELLELLRKLLLTEMGIIEEEKIEGLNLSALRKLVKLFLEAAYTTRTAAIAELPLELAVGEWFINTNQKKDEESNDEDEKISSVKVENTDNTTGKNASKGKKIFSSIKSSWPKILEKLRPQNHSLEALLKAAEPIEIEKDVIIIGVAYQFHKDQLELSRYKEMVRKVVCEILGGNYSIKYVLQKMSKNENVKRVDENIKGGVRDEAIVKAAEEIFGVDIE